MHIEVEDDGRYNATGISTIIFESEKGPLFHLKDVMFVPKVKNNLILVAILEDHAYDAIFSKRKAFMRDIAIGQVKQTGV